MKNARRAVLALLTAAAMITAVAAGDRAKVTTVQGKVTAASGGALTIVRRGEPMTFVVDTTTKVIGKGLTTKTNEKAARGQKLTLSDTLAAGDMVTVTYHEADGKLYADAIKVTQKALMSR